MSITWSSSSLQKNILPSKWTYMYDCRVDLNEQCPAQLMLLFGIILSQEREVQIKLSYKLAFVFFAPSNISFRKIISHTIMHVHVISDVIIQCTIKIAWDTKINILPLPYVKCFQFFVRVQFQRNHFKESIIKSETNHTALWIYNTNQTSVWWPANSILIRKQTRKLRSPQIPHTDQVYVTVQVYCQLFNKLIENL